MTNPVLMKLDRKTRRAALKAETVARRTGLWGSWEMVELPNGAAGAGWPSKVSRAYRNNAFAVLVRKVEIEEGGVMHAAVSSLSGIRPTFHEMQRIKDELFGPEETAVEVYPPRSRLTDDADMFHLWICGPLPFGIGGEEDKA